MRDVFSQEEEGGNGGGSGSVRTYFLQDLTHAPATVWGPQTAFIKSLSKGASSGHVSLQVRA